MIHKTFLILILSRQQSDQVLIKLLKFEFQNIEKTRLFLFLIDFEMDLHASLTYSCFVSKYLLNQKHRQSVKSFAYIPYFRRNLCTKREQKSNLLCIYKYLDVFRIHTVFNASVKVHF